QEDPLAVGGRTQPLADQTLRTSQLVGGSQIETDVAHLEQGVEYADRHRQLYLGSEAQDSRNSLSAEEESRKVHEASSRIGPVGCHGSAAQASLSRTPGAS